MTCERVNSLLTLYVDEGLPARDTGRVAGHLTRCAACRAELHALEKTLSALDRVRPQTPPVDLWEQFCLRLEAQGSPRTVRANAKTRAFCAPWRLRVLSLPWFAAPAAVLAAALVGLAGFAIGMRSGSQNRPMTAWLPPHRATVSSEAKHGRTSRDARGTNGVAVAQRRMPGAVGAELPLYAPITPPEAAPWRGALGADRASSPARAADRLTTAARGGDAALGPSGTPAAGGTPRPSAAGEWLAASSPSSPAGISHPADVAEALQASVEETTRQRIADEVALLAQELDRADAHTSDFFGPSGPGEPS